jgi:hypothetical protein
METKGLLPCLKQPTTGPHTNEVTGIFNLPNPFCRTKALWSTQSLAELSTSHLPGHKALSVHKPDNPTAIFELTIWKMWEARFLTTLWASRTVIGIVSPFSLSGIYIFTSIVRDVSDNGADSLSAIRGKDSALFGPLRGASPNNWHWT